MSRLIDAVGNFLAERKGLLPLLGAALVVGNFAVRLASPDSFLAATDLMLHLGILLGILGLLLARVL